MKSKKNKGYADLVNFWEGKQSHINADQAYKSLMELAGNLKTGNTIYHKDFIDAMFRQVRTETAIPFGNNGIDKEAIISATSYDLGPNGYAYADNDTANYWVSDGKHVIYNRGRLYRNDGVDIKESAAAGAGGYCVSWIEKGEWLQYTLHVMRHGNYRADIGYSAADTAGMVDLFVNGRSVNSNIILPERGKDSTSITVKSIHLNKGTNTIKIAVSSGGFDLNYLKFTRN